LLRGIHRFSRGELNRSVKVDGIAEMTRLGEALNRMATELGERLTRVTGQANLQQAILSSMTEGVIAVDTEERLIDINRAAARLIGMDEHPGEDRSIQEIVRSSGLRKLITQALSSRQSVEREIIFREEGEERYVQGHATALRDSSGANIGVLVVLNDITRMRRLENVRRDFVANVSHELKTPITSIKGFVETLLDSSFDDIEEVRRFLSIINSQSERLDSIIEDLLSLSRIEQEAESGGIGLAETNIEEILAGAVANCELPAASKGIVIDIHCDPELTARVNARLLEQAVVNLVDNAIKYSYHGSEIVVSAGKSDDQLVIEVIDSGAGIPEEHQPRIFERFYRVDKSRSRTLGGTGLGLAIVKHIALAHKGTVSVESKQGHGSRFKVIVPVRPD
jgi:two-component system phosphate regulon sensor histidine kinase PhoR